VVYNFIHYEYPLLYKDFTVAILNFSGNIPDLKEMLQIYIKS